MGSGLAFCFLPACLKKDQEFHTNALKSHCKDESVIDISYHQDEIATLPCPFIKRAGSPAI
jgi:hypothetical protein